MASAWLVGAYAFYICACQFDPFWWSQRRELLETVKRRSHVATTQLSEIQQVIATIPAVRHGGIST